MPKSTSAAGNKDRTDEPSAVGASATANTQSMRGFGRSLPMSLLKAHEAVLRTFVPHLRAHDLSTQQWRVMRALSEKDARDISELARACSLLRPSVSRILQNLEGRGIVLRQPCDWDSRRSLVSITELGRDLIAQLAPESEARYQYIEARYGREKLEQLYQLLNDLSESLDEPPPPFGSLTGEQK